MSDALRRGFCKRRMNNKYVKILFLNIAIIVTMIVCYSEGFLELRPWDASILRAGMAIFMAIAGAFAFFFGNYALLKEPERRTFSQENLVDLSQARAVLSSYHGGRYFGKIADTTSDQLARLERTMDRTKSALGMKFAQGSMSYDRYDATVKAAQEAALSNVIAMANRMQIFDEKDYARLKHYKNDRIPNDIQQKQIALYTDNMRQIEAAVAANEELILALDTMSLELARPGEVNETDPLLEEIHRLTEQVKLYS